MTRVIVNDASCLIDLRKGGLLEVVCDLPYRLVVPLPVRVSEVLDFSAQQWRHLDDHGMITRDLTPGEVGQAFAIREHHRALSANDCFCLVAASAYCGILLTGDAQLRRAAADKGLRVHGVLWVIDELVAASSQPSAVVAASDVADLPGNRGWCQRSCQVSPSQDRRTFGSAAEAATVAQPPM